MPLTMEQIFCVKTYHKIKSSRLFKQDTKGSSIATHFQTVVQLSSWSRALKLMTPVKIIRQRFLHSQASDNNTATQEYHPGSTVSRPESVQIFATVEPRTWNLYIFCSMHSDYGSHTLFLLDPDQAPTDSGRYGKEDNIAVRWNG